MIFLYFFSHGAEVRPFVNFPQQKIYEKVGRLSIFADSHVKTYVVTKKVENWEEELHHFAIVEGKRVPVTKEVFNCLRQTSHHEQYLEERDEKNGLMSFHVMDDTDEYGDVVSGEDTIVDTQTLPVEDQVVLSLMSEKLTICLEMLEENEKELVWTLFFDGFSEREWSRMTGTPLMTINSRKTKILGKLKKLLKK